MNNDAITILGEFGIDVRANDTNAQYKRKLNTLSPGSAERQRLESAWVAFRDGRTMHLTDAPPVPLASTTQSPQQPSPKPFIPVDENMAGKSKSWLQKNGVLLGLMLIGFVVLWWLLKPDPAPVTGSAVTASDSLSQKVVQSKQEQSPPEVQPVPPAPIDTAKEELPPAVSDPQPTPSTVIARIDGARDFRAAYSAMLAAITSEKHSEGHHSSFLGLAVAIKWAIASKQEDDLYDMIVRDRAADEKKPMADRKIWKLVSHTEDYEPLMNVLLTSDTKKLQEIEEHIRKEIRDQ